MRSSISTAILLVGLAALPAMSAEHCVFNPYTPDPGIVLKAALDPATFTLQNPLPEDVLKAAETKELKDAGIVAAKLDASVTAACWQSADEAVNGKACADSDHFSKAAPLPLTVGYCTEKPENSTTVALDVFPTLQVNLDEFTKAKGFVIRYAPGRVDKTDSFLRVEWDVVGKKGETLTDAQKKLLPLKHHLTYKVSGTAGVARFDEDSRYKLWLYTGYTFRSSKNDFKDSYPEIRFRAETRLVDELIAMEQREQQRYLNVLSTGKKCDAETGKKCGRATFNILRIYGEGGLTSVDVENNAGGMTTTADRSRQTFDGNFGVGYGKTMIVSTRNPGDTTAFAILGIARFGVVSIPGTAAVAATATTAAIPAGDTKVAFDDMFGIRIENETGHFAGAYFETGFGESEQYTGKKSPRWRADGFLPMNDPGGLYRIAGRIQLDRHSPLSDISGKSASASNADVRISILFNVDLKELTHRLRVSQPGTP